MKREEMSKGAIVNFIEYNCRYPYIDCGYISCIIDDTCIVNGELHHCSNVSTSVGDLQQVLYRVLNERLNIFAKLVVEAKKEL